METRQDIMAWRRQERQQLIAQRMAQSVEWRQLASATIAENLDAWCRGNDLLKDTPTVSGYWPLRGEPDLRPWLARLHGEGIQCAMPVVVEKGAALRFRPWQPGAKMEKGFWDIPVPADTREVWPNLLLAPVVGFDARCYRLGYGGGYFDRTLALLNSRAQRWHALGIGYELAQIPTVHPLPHDIPLHAVVTEAVTRSGS